MAAQVQYSSIPFSSYDPVVELGPVNATAPSRFAVPLAFMNWPVPPTAVSVPDKERPDVVGDATPMFVVRSSSPFAAVYVAVFVYAIPDAPGSIVWYAITDVRPR